MRTILPSPYQSVLLYGLLLLWLGNATLASAQQDGETQRFTPPPPATGVYGPNDQLPSYDELPLEIRRELNRPQLSIHYYHQDPEQRYAMINGFRGREGLPIGQELWIQEIRPDGVVMRVQDQFFLIKP